MFTLVTLAALATAQDKPAAYAKPDLLAEPAAFQTNAARKGVVFLDARRKAEYLIGHIPGARWVDAAAWAKGFGDGGDKEGWAKTFGTLGLKPDATIVIYDAAQSKDAARIWWILRYWGFEDVRLLNGGWGGWVSAKGEASKEPPEVKVTDPELKARPARLAARADLLAELKDKSLGQLIDARSEGEHCGDTKTAERNGSVPGAKHLEWSDTIDKKTGRFKSQDELTKLFEKAGVDPKKPTTTYCQSGGRASVMAFALELHSGKEARNYYKSWAEWGNDKDAPIVTPKKK